MTNSIRFKSINSSKISTTKTSIRARRRKANWSSTANRRWPLRKALNAKPPLDLYVRIDSIIAKLERVELPQELVVQQRVLEVLERIGDDAARKAAKQLSEGNKGAPLTEAAKATLARMEQRSKSP